MNCRQFQDVYQDLARDEALGLRVMKDAFAHADSCPACDALLQESESLTAGLRALAERDAAEEAPVRVEVALLAALQEKQPTRAQPSGVRLFSLVGVAGIAAMALFTVFLVRHTRPAATTQTSAANAPASEPASPSVAEEVSAASAEKVNSASTILSGSAGTQSADSFVPLSDTFDPSSVDGMVVRVVLSRSDMESFGLPVNEAEQQQVVADMIVTGDGTPQAIRVVGW